MSHLYPSLHEKFRSEGLCPICLMEMAYTPRFSCGNSHVICHRCRPYYYSCPQCLQPLNELPPMPGPYEPASPQLMPSPACPYPPSAPNIQEFHAQEARRYPPTQHLNWAHGRPPSPPREDQELLDCPYSHLGCTAKFVLPLRDIHVSRCQYKHHSSEIDRPTECFEPGDSVCYEPGDSERQPCRYQSVGCNVRTTSWRLRNHEELCIYKDRAPEPLEELSQHLEGSCQLGEGDPNRMVECRFRHRGCMVRMPYWKKQSHEAKCNHADGSPEHYPRPAPRCYPSRDPEEQVDCRWACYGCRVRPKLGRRETHEAKCNHRMEECCYSSRGCTELLDPTRKYAHESSCNYAY